MAATNAISGISLVASLVVAGSNEGVLATALGTIAVAGTAAERDDNPEPKAEGKPDVHFNLGSHEVSPAGAISYFFAHSPDDSIDAEGDEHDGREPGEDDEPALGWDNSVDQTDNGGGSMNLHECEPSLGSTSAINQEAWALGLSNDLEQGTTRNFTRKSNPPTDPRARNVRWPDGSAVDLASIASNVVTVDG
jgi:hypothetical protein